MAQRRKSQRAERRASHRRRNRRATARVTLAVASLTLGAQTAGADIYTRINGRRVLEATDLPASPRDSKLAYRRKGTPVHTAGVHMRASPNTEFDAHIHAAAELHRVSPALVRAIIQVESGFDRLAVSIAGARGLMQLTPATARRFGVTDCFDARQNIFAGTRYLRALLDTYGEDVSLSAAAYNAGEGAVARYGGVPPFRETRSFVRRVNALLAGVGDALALAAPAPAPLIVLGEAPGKARASQPADPVVEEPRVYYRWRDLNGMVHVEQAPPAAGEFTTIRSTDSRGL